MQELLTVFATWLSLTSALPANYETPKVELVSASEMLARRYSFEAASNHGPVAIDTHHDVHAVYDDRNKTIYLLEGWSAESPADVSVLLHEMVHHLQNVGGLEYDCPEARERPAYEAQARWLELVGKSLAEEFELDAMTLLVRTNCLH